MIKRLGSILVVLATLAPVPAAAEWMRASTPHFVVYGDLSEAAIRKQAADLELFDAALRRFQRVPDTEDARHNKVTLYVLSSLEAIRDLAQNDGVAGFYVPRVSGSVLFTPRTGSGGGVFALNPRVVLFHEYAHHFMRGNFTAAMPAWFSEGYAEFAGTVQITDTQVMLGAAANHRSESLSRGRALTAAQLFDPPRNISNGEMVYLYGRGWLLTHMILFDRARFDQFAKYLSLLNHGTSSREAAQQAFGDLRQLDRDMDAALARPLPAYVMPRTGNAVAAAEVRPLTAGEKALIDLRILSTRGVDERSAKSVFARARTAAAPFRQDAVAQGWLAEMAYDAGDDAAAEAAADAALAVDPNQGQALLYKARVLLRRAAKGGAADRWTQARSYIVRANKADPNNAAALLLYYETFKMAGEAPTPGAIDGLFRVIALAPQDEDARFQAARQLLVENKIDDAREVLRPIAFAPHSRPDNPAAKLLAALDAGQTGPDAIKALDEAAKAKDQNKGGSE